MKEKEKIKIDFFLQEALGTEVFDLKDLLFNSLKDVDYQSEEYQVIFEFFNFVKPNLIFSSPLEKDEVSTSGYWIWSLFLSATFFF